MAALILFAGLSLAQESHAVLSSTPPEQASAGTDDGKRVLNFGPTSGMKTADLDDPNSALSKKIAFIVKGNGKPSKWLSRTTPSSYQAMTQVMPSMASGDHIFDIFTGSDFKAEDLSHMPTANSETIRVRDLSTKTLLTLPLKYDQNYNFAVTIDWDKNTLAVASSIDSAPLQPQGGPMPNDPKAMNPEFKQKGEFHLQLIKMPLPNPKDSITERSDTPHRGVQELITNEHVMFSNVFAVQGSKLVNPHSSRSGKGKKVKACKRNLI
ncbi:uncharacterized protein VP01_1280g4 [Puccinia sorghi]|uniref:Glycoside hydrolase 131 catalytic N-terminal domain-containing protein n=1 Tax=Puccinia sorghi TaxID=27349 RepID=A0A0L6VNT6_9BASI|nr:uncharacterized protein VP01_1280g4 [Puccinia sorghi]